MTTRSSALGSFTTTGTREAHTLYVSAAGFATILKTVYVMPASPIDPDVELYVHSSLTGTQVWLLAGAVPKGKPFGWEGWIVLEPGDFIGCFADNPGVRFWASGAVLPVPS